MLRKYMKATVSVAITVFLLVSIVSCEEDFTDIGTSIVNNGEFSTNDTVFEIEVTGKKLRFKVVSDNTIRGAAGYGVLLAELLLADGILHDSNTVLDGTFQRNN